MDAKEAIKARHSVREYLDKPLEAAKCAVIRAAIEQINAKSGLNIQLVLDEPKAFSTGMWKYGKFSGVKNYFVMAGPKGKDAEEKVGYYGEDLVLLSQTLGLNTCWVGLTYTKIPGAYTLREGDMVHCVIALGYGSIPGVQHPLKPAENYYEAETPVPEWFLEGMEAVMLAPTALNQQKFRFTLVDGNKVKAEALFSMAGYTAIDLGIVKLHFEAAAGKKNFEWA